MATFTRPTFTQILNSVQADINTRLPGADATLRYSVLNVIAYVIAGVAHGLYGFIAWVALQVFPDTATSDNLRRWAAIWGVQPLPATQATGNIEVTGTNGTLIPDGTEFSRSDGVLYTSNGDETISGGIATISVTSEEAGSTTNSSVGTVLSFVSPITNVSTSGTVDSDGITGGTDDESDASLEQRLLDRIQNPPQGGDAHDYIQWALQVAGVTRAWVYPMELGIGTVTVRFMMDNSYDDGIPLSGDVTTVSNYIDDLRPVTAAVTVVAPTAVELDFTIHLNIADSAAIRASVEANLREMILNDGEPNGTIYISRINEMISLATGEYDHVLTVPAANVVYTSGDIPVMGTITWT
jgi:uncharacterized phage protein gp47/JayE